MRATTWLQSLQIVERGLRFLLAACGLGFIGLFYWIAYHRFRFPMQLEWAEGGVIDMVRRIAAHQQLYVAPSKSFIPFMYTPLYYYVSAALGHFTGVTLPTLRVVSIASTTGCFLVLFGYVQRVTGSAFAGWAASGLFAALFSVANGWFDLARIDMLCLLFLLIALDLSQRGQAIWAAVAFAAAFQTKQSVLVIAVLVLAHEFRRPRKLVEGLGVFAILAGGSAWWLNHENHGWYSYYTTFLPAHQAWKLTKLFSFLRGDLILPLGMTFLLILVAALLPEEGKRRDGRQTAFFLLATVGIGAATVSARLHLGGINNVTLPLYGWICILFGLSLHKLTARAKQLTAGLSQVFQVAILTGCVLQFAQLTYVPTPFVPSAQQTAEAHHLIQEIAELPGSIYVVHNVVDAGSSGKQGFANSMAIWDVLRADHGPVGRNLKAELIQSFQEKDYAGVLDEGSPMDMDPVERPYLTEMNQAIVANYPVEQRMMTPVESMLSYGNPLTQGMKPNVLYLPAK